MVILPCSCVLKGCLDYFWASYIPKIVLLEIRLGLVGLGCLFSGWGGALLLKRGVIRILIFFFFLAVVQLAAHYI